MKAILIGATGLVGSEILKKLIVDSCFSEIVVLTRRPLSQKDGKIREYLVDFEDTQAWKENVQGDVLFSALGTTLKKAGSKEAQARVDYHYQFEVARIARHNGVRSLIQISSVGAHSKSPFFYLRMKGQLEEALKGLSFEKCCLLQPGPLAGKREQERPQEKWLIQFLEWLPKIPGMESYWPIRASDVAKVAVEEASSGQIGFYQLKPKALFNR